MLPATRHAAGDPRWAAACCATCLVREEPFLFRPGDFYALVAGAGAGLFCLLAVQGWSSGQAAAVVIPVTFALRVLSHRLGWTTRPTAT